MLLGYLKVDICRGLFSEAVTPWLMTVRSVKMKSWGWSGKGASAVLESSAKAVTAIGESSCGWGWGWWDEATLPRGCLVYIGSEPTWVHVFGDCPAACDLQGGSFTLRAKTASSRSLSQMHCFFLLYHRWVGRIDPQIQKVSQGPPKRSCRYLQVEDRAPALVQRQASGSTCVKEDWSGKGSLQG